MVTASKLQLTIKNYHFLSFGIVSKKNVYNYLKKQLIASFTLFQLGVCVRQDFLQSKQQIMTEWWQKQKWDSDCLLLSQPLKRCAKNAKQ